MNVDTFSKYLIAVLTALEILNLIVFLFLIGRLGSKSIVVATVLMFTLNILTILLLNRIKVTDKDGKPVKSIFSLFGDMIAVSMWMGIVSVIVLIIGYFSIPKDKVSAFLVPILSVGIVFLSLAIVDHYNN